MMRFKNFLITALVGASLLMPLSPRALEVSAMSTDTQDRYNLLLTQLKMMAEQLDARAGTVENTVTTLDNLVNGTNGFNARITSLENTAGNYRDNLVKSTSDLFAGLNDCVTKGETKCLPTLKMTEQRLGKSSSGGTVYGDLYKTTGVAYGSAAEYHEKLNYYHSDIKVAEYPFCTMNGSGDLSWKRFRIFKGSTYWDAEIEERTHWWADSTEGYIRIICYKIS